MTLRASHPLLVPLLVPLSIPLSVPLSILCCSSALSAWGEVRKPEHFASLRKPSNLGVVARSRSESTAAPTAESTPAMAW
ncbi:MAG TPA: hypothetical protein PK472_07010 [Pseudomonadota bacterium]|nr:hypothetical protein [Pseudomonadota bacterium]